MEKEESKKAYDLMKSALLWEVEPNMSDWELDIKLPDSLNLDYEISQLLGVVWADGCQKGIDRLGIRLSFSDKNVSLYKEFVLPKFEEKFNLTMNIKQRKISPTSVHVDAKHFVNFGEHNDFYSDIRPGAVDQMIRNINFPLTGRKRNVELPRLIVGDAKKQDKFSYDKKGFLEGVVAGMGTICKWEDRSYYNIKIYDKDKAFVHNLKKLIDDTQISSKCAKYASQPSYYLDILGSDTLGIDLINPRHRDETKYLKNE